MSLLVYQYVTEDMEEVDDVKFDLVVDWSPSRSSFEGHGETAKKSQVSGKRGKRVSHSRRREE